MKIQLYEYLESQLEEFLTGKQRFYIVTNVSVINNFKIGSDQRQINTAIVRHQLKVIQEIKMKYKTELTSVTLLTMLTLNNMTEKINKHI